jgi:hypothetical protein
VADPKSFINQNVDVAGWLVATPPLKCLGAGPYSCSEVDWITDESFQPWVSDGQTGSTRAPVVGIRVQNGAYDAFAPSPAISDFGARTPRLGDWTVRESISSCSAGQPGGPSCIGGSAVRWEVVARLP